MTESPLRHKKLDVNSAPAEVLAQVPGLDAELALRIIARRPFRQTKELLRVPGLEYPRYEQATPYLKVARPRSTPTPTSTAARPAPRPRRAAKRPVPPPADPVSMAPVQVHVHVNAGPGAEATTYRSLPGGPLPPPDVVEPVIIAEPGPAAWPGRSLAPRSSTALVPLTRQVSTALFESYAGPRVVLALFSFTLLAVALAFASGQLHWGGLAASAAPALASPAPADAQLATAVSAALAATQAAQSPTELPSPTAPAPTASPAPATAASVLPTATTTFISNSGLAGVGSLLFNETFVPAGYWSVGETDFSRIAVETGWLRVLIKSPGNIAWVVNSYSAADFYFQGLMQMSACQLGDYAGLVFRQQDDLNLYLFGLACDGRYRLVRRVNGEFQFLIDFTFTPEAATGSEAANLLAVRAEGRRISLYVNDQPVAVYNEADPTPGFFGAFAKAGATTNLQTSFDDMSAWGLSP